MRTNNKFTPELSGEPFSLATFTARGSGVLFFMNDRQRELFQQCVAWGCYLYQRSESGEFTVLNQNKVMSEEYTTEEYLDMKEPKMPKTVKLERQEIFMAAYKKGFDDAIKALETIKSSGYSRIKEALNLLEQFLGEDLYLWKINKMYGAPWSALIVDQYIKEKPIFTVKPWWKVRQEVLQRDGYSCSLCGSRWDLEVDHIFPVSRGGLPIVENLQTLCKGCHKEKTATRKEAVA